MKKTVISAVAAVGLVLAPSAAAHVTVNPNEVEAGSFSRFAIRVPNERPKASTTKVVVRLPAGLEFVSFQPKPGWKRTTTMAKLDQPVTSEEGETITERIATVTWEGGSIAPGEFDEFGLSAKVPDTAGTTLVFPANQTYSNGEVVRWIGPPDADAPASRVKLAAAGGEEATSAARAPAAATNDGDDSTKENVALGFGIAGLVAGLTALALALLRRPHRA
jgi:periplasmic copper chaperone A